MEFPTGYCALEFTNGEIRVVYIVSTWQDTLSHPLVIVISDGTIYNFNDIRSIKKEEV